MSKVIFRGPAGRIEGRYHHTKHKTAPIAIILHPHFPPQFNETMSNKVVYTLYRSFANFGFNTLRFNFRGAGQSEGTYDNSEGELSDAASALDWLQAKNIGASTCWVAGFSFGAWIGMQLLMRRPEIEGFVSVSLPADLHNFGFLAPCPAPGLVIQGEKDNLISHNSVAQLINTLQLQRGLQIDYQKIPMADHFFTNKLSKLSHHVNAYLSRNLLQSSIKNNA